MQDQRLSENNPNDSTPSLLHVAASPGMSSSPYKAIFDHSPTATVITDAFGVIQDINHAGETLLLIRRKSWLGKPLSLLLTDEKAKEEIAHYLDSIPKRKRSFSQTSNWLLHPSGKQAVPIRMEFTIIPSSGNSGRLITWSFFPEKDTGASSGQGDPQNATSVKLLHNRQIVHAIFRQYSLLQAIMEHTRAHLALIDPEGNYLAVNTAYAAASGYSCEYLIGKNLFHLFPHSEVQSLLLESKETLQPVSRYAQPYEFPNQPDRGVTYWDWTLAPVISEDHLQGFVISIHDVMQAVNSQKENEQLLKEADGLRNLVDAVIRNSPAGMMLLGGTDLRIHWANPALESLLESPFDKGIVGLRADEIITNEEDIILLDILRYVANTGITRMESEFAFHGFDKGIIYLQAMAIPIPDGDSPIQNVLVTLLDVTPQTAARNRANEAAAEAERERRLLEAVVESMPLGLLIADGEGGYLRSNETRSRIWGGFEPASRIADYRQYKGRFPRTGAMVRPEEWPIARAIKKGEVIRNEEIEIERFDGTWRTALFSAVPIRDLEGNILGGVSVLEDVTEQRQASKDLAREKQKAEYLAQERLEYLHRLNRLISISQDILSETTVVGLLERMADVACDLTGARIGLSGYPYKNGHFETGVIARTGKSYRHLHGGKFQLAEGEIYEELIQKKKAFHLTETELREERESIGLSSSHVVLRGIVGAPLITRNGDSLGVIIVSDKAEGDFSSEDEALLNELAAIASLSLRHIEAAIEEQHRADEMDATFTALVDQLIIYDTDGKATKANPAAAEAIGFDPVGHSRGALTEKIQTSHLDGTPVTISDLPSSIALQGVPVSGLHYIITDAAGRKMVVQVSCAPIRSNNQIVGAVCALRDVTERENLLDQLQRERELAENRAKEAENTRLIYNAILEYMPEGVCIASLNDLRLLFMSRYGFDILGIPPEEAARGIDVAEMLRKAPFYTPNNRLATVDEIPIARAILQKEFIFNEEWIVERADSTRRILLCNAAPLCDGDGNATGGIMLWRDISERKRTEEALRASEEFQSAILNAMEPMIAVLDSEGMIIATNAAWLNSASTAGNPFLQYLAIGANYLDSCRNACVAEAGSALDGIVSVMNGSAPNFQMEYACALLQETKWFLMTAVPLPVGAGGAVISHTEISQGKRTEEDLRQITLELRRSNGDLMHFAHTVSHDLMEPLRGVVGHLQILQRRYEDHLDADGRGIMDFVIASGKRMGQMIDGLLNYARVGSLGEAFQPVDAEEALRLALLNLEESMRENNAVVTHAPLPVIISNRLQLSQLFQNLIGNALKFHGDRLPEIHVNVSETEESWIFSVHDNGIGIDVEHSERIFGMFQRVNGPEVFAGSGVGLSICKRIVDRHGGRIWVESKLGEGSTFYISLPKRSASFDREDSGFC